MIQNYYLTSLMFFHKNNADMVCKQGPSTGPWTYHGPHKFLTLLHDDDEQIKALLRYVVYCVRKN